jgi:hypothetical protein
VLLLAACGDDENPPTETADTDVEDTSADMGADVEDVNLPDVVTPDIPGEDMDPGEVVCRYCRTSAQCGGLENLCLQLPSGESVCGIDCAAGEEICPEETFCANIGGEGVRQCVPVRLFCENQCGDPPMECEDDSEICDPLTGQCGPPLGLCDECAVDEQCGEGNLCLSYPDIDNYRGCGRACDTENLCPADYVCAIVDTEGLIRQCVPEILTCIDRCVDVVCDELEVCNPLNGECETPLELCSECMSSAQCGGEFDLCIRLLDNIAYCSQDCGPTAGENAGNCPPGYICYPLDGGVSQCIPTQLTCVNHCEDEGHVECPEGQNCNPVDGACHLSTLDLCDAPCENSYDCGGQDDLCISFADTLGGAFCAGDCDDETPCPIGYTCSPLTDGLTNQCAPTDFDDVCLNCNDVECPEDEACRPSHGTCHARPDYCITHDDCTDGELCNTFENRCEPLGLDCRFREYGHCTFDMNCSAASYGVEDGLCLQRCTATPDGCPDTAPECESYYQVFNSCVERGLGGPERCGRLNPWIESVGQPCPNSETDPTCPVAADLCLEGILPGIPGFCTSICNVDDETACPSGGSCRRVPGTLNAYCLPDTCGCMALPLLDEGEEDLLQLALDEYGLSRCDVSYNLRERRIVGNPIANDPFRVALTGLVRNEALYGAEVARSHSADAVDGSLLAAIQMAAGDLGHDVFGALPIAVGEPTFCEAISSLYVGSGDDPPNCDDGDLGTETAAIPVEVIDDLSLAIAMAGWATAQVESFLPPDITAVEFDDLAHAIHRIVIPDDGEVPDVYANRDALLDYKYQALYDAAGSLAFAIEDGELMPSREVGLDDLEIDLETPMGRVLIMGDLDHTYCDTEDDCQGADNPVILDSPVLFLYDTGGDDLYLTAAASTNAGQRVSVLIDLGGDDTYSYVTDDEDGDLLAEDGDGRADSPPVSLSMTGRQGSARGGIALLFDWGQGMDHYESLRMSQGSGLLGLGALVDDGCETETEESCGDTFQSESLSQGAGLFGIGILLSGSGDTAYYGHHLVQGAAGPLGAGLLLDRAGDDDYVASPGGEEDILFPAPTLVSRGNWSAAQGSGIGVPSDMPGGGGNLSGGIGLLIDLDGADTYLAGIGAQGSGYWHGLGMLIDGAGNDRYDTYGLAQGAGTDFGIGILAEQAGDDEYNEEETLDRFVLGSGNNYGVGLVVEESGNDTFHAASQSLGVGFFNGTGIFIDNLGNDSYALSSDETLGKATLSVLGSEPSSNPRRGVRSLGLFIDASGVDAYSGRGLDTPRITNDRVWTQSTLRVDGLLEWGAGADGDGGSGVTTLP